jgi:hypothetical protein
MSGTLASAELAARLDQQGRMVFTVTDDAVTNAEDDGSSIAQTFISRQPPTSADTALAAKVSEALDAGTTALTDLRIAVRQHDSAGVRRAIGELTTARVTCQRLTAQLQ